MNALTRFIWALKMGLTMQILSSHSLCTAKESKLYQASSFVGEYKYRKLKGNTFQKVSWIPNLAKTLLWLLSDIVFCDTVR